MEPTAEGKRRYTSQPVGYYDGLPCTCVPECPVACKGDNCEGMIGCEACAAAYSDFLSTDYS